MGPGAPHVLSALDPSYLLIVRVRCTGHGLWKHILTKKLRCGRPNPVNLQIVFCGRAVGSARWRCNVENVQRKCRGGAGAVRLKEVRLLVVNVITVEQ